MAELFSVKTPNAIFFQRATLNILVKPSIYTLIVVVSENMRLGSGTFLFEWQPFGIAVEALIATRRRRGGGSGGLYP